MPKNNIPFEKTEEQNDENEVLVAFHRVSKKYQNGNTALENCSFFIYKNECLAILGHNGAGKTTLIKLLIGLLQPTTGTIEFSNICAQKTISIASVLDDIGSYDDMSVRDNMLFFGALYGINPDVIEQRYSAILERFHLLSVENSKVAHLSLGQKRVVSLCRSLLSNPKLLIVDELLAGLDPVNQVRLLDFLLNYQKESLCSIVFCSHDLQHTNFLAHRVVAFSHGQILFTNHMKDIDNYHCCELTRDVNEIKEILKQYHGKILYYIRSNNCVTCVFHNEENEFKLFLSRNYPDVLWRERKAILEDVYLAFTKYDCTESGVHSNKEKQ